MSEQKQFKAMPEAMRQAATWSNEIPFIEPIVESLRKEGKSELEIAQAAYDYVASQCNSRDFKFAAYLNNQIYGGIDSLSSEGKWSNLTDVARVALETAIVTLRGKIKNNEADTLYKNMLTVLERKYKFITIGISGYREFANELLVLANEYDAKEAAKKAAKTK